MSAFVVSDETIAGMLQAIAPKYPGDGASYYYSGEVHYFGGNERKIGQTLLDENYRSVNYRYSEKSEAHKYTGPFLMGQLKPVEIIKLCHCYNYQACETPDYEDTEAAAIVRALENRAIRALPGYDAAKWGI